MCITTSNILWQHNIVFNPSCPSLNFPMWPTSNTITYDSKWPLYKTYFGYSIHCTRLVSVLLCFVYAYGDSQSLNSVAAYFSSRTKCLFHKRTHCAKRTWFHALKHQDSLWCIRNDCTFAKLAPSIYGWCSSSMSYQKGSQSELTCDNHFNALS